MFILDEKNWLEAFQALLAIDSTTGCCREIEDYLAREIENMGFPVLRPHKGGVIADLGGEGDTLCVTAHVDDIGLMVRRINSDGTLNAVSYTHLDVYKRQAICGASRPGSVPCWVRCCLPSSLSGRAAAPEPPPRSSCWNAMNNLPGV